VKFKDSRIVRVLKLDASDPLNLKTVGMYAFEASDPKEYSRTSKASDLKISSAQVVKKDVLVIGERVDDLGLRLITLDFTNATNLMGTVSETALNVEDTSVTRTVQLAVSKVVFDTADLTLDERTPMLQKMEGIAILSPATMLVISDNDFGLNGLNTFYFTVSLTSKLDISTPLSVEPQFEYSDDTANYFKIHGPGSEEMLSKACEIRGGKLVRVVNPRTSIQQGLGRCSVGLGSGSGICSVSK
jgi:hypothetical protein